MRKTWNAMLAMSRTAVLFAVGLTVVAGLMLFKLGSLTPGLSPVEIDTYNSTRSLSQIAEITINAPYNTAVFISTKIFNNAFGLRLPGAMVGIISVGLFYSVARKICGEFVALAATFMFASSTLMLLVTRTATASVMLLSLLAIVACGFYVRFGKRTDIASMVTSAVLALSLYVPGMIVFIVAAAAWQFRRVRKPFESLKTPAIITTSVIFGVLTVPLIVGFIREPGLWRSYLGLPEAFLTLSEMARSLFDTFAGLFIVSPGKSPYWLGRQPVLDVFAVAMFVVGVATLAKQYSLDRAWTLLGIFVLSAGWIAVSGNNNGVIVLLPFIYGIIAIGIQIFINKWLAVFPKNPIARYTGAVLLAAVIIMSINFQSHRYFVAWANNDTTEQTFSHQLPL